MCEAFELARPFHFESNGDRYGLTETADGRHHLTLFIENGRLLGKLMDGLRDVARIHGGTFRLTPNQNLIIAGVKSEVRTEEHTSELQSLMRSSYAVFCLNKKKYITNSMAQTATSCDLNKHDT